MSVNRSRVGFEKAGVPVSLVFGQQTVSSRPSAPSVAEGINAAAEAERVAAENASLEAARVQREETDATQRQLLQSMRNHISNLERAHDSFIQATPDVSRVRRKPSASPGAQATQPHELPDMESSLRSGLAVLEGTVAAVESPSMLASEHRDPMNGLLIASMRLANSAATASHITGAVVHAHTGGKDHAFKDIKRRFDRVTMKSRWDATDTKSVGGSVTHKPANPNKKSGKHTGNNRDSKKRVDPPPEKEPIRGRDMYEFIDAFVDKQASIAHDHGSLKRSRVLERYSVFLHNQVDRLKQAAVELNTWWYNHPVHAMTTFVQNAASLSTNKRGKRPDRSDGAWEPSSEAVDLILDEVAAMADELANMSDAQATESMITTTDKIHNALMAECNEYVRGPDGSANSAGPSAGGGDTDTETPSMGVGSRYEDESGRGTEVTHIGVSARMDYPDVNAAAGEADVEAGEADAANCPVQSVRDIGNVQGAISSLCVDVDYMMAYAKTMKFDGDIENGMENYAHDALMGFIGWIVQGVDWEKCTFSSTYHGEVSEQEARFAFASDAVIQTWVTHSGAVHKFSRMLAEVVCGTCDEEGDTSAVDEIEMNRLIDERYIQFQENSMQLTLERQEYITQQMDERVLTGAEAVFRLLLSDHEQLRKDKRVTLDVFWDKGRNSLAVVFYQMVALHIGLAQKLNGVRSTTVSDTVTISNTFNVLACEFAGARVVERSVETIPPFTGSRSRNASTIRCDLVVIESATDRGGGSTGNLDNSVSSGPCPHWYLCSDPHRRAVRQIVSNLWRTKHPMSVIEGTLF